MHISMKRCMIVAPSKKVLEIEYLFLVELCLIVLVVVQSAYQLCLDVPFYAIYVVCIRVWYCGLILWGFSRGNLMKDWIEHQEFMMFCS